MDSQAGSHFILMTVIAGLSFQIIVPRSLFGTTIAAERFFGDT